MISRMGIRGLVGVLAVATGCYAPSIDVCLYHCDTGGGCPNGLVCNGGNWCAADKDMSCDGILDAKRDTGAGCVWHDVSNVDPCAQQFDTVMGDWSIAPTDVVTVNTNAGTVTHAATGVVFPSTGVLTTIDQLAGGDRVFVIAVHDLTMQGPINVMGSLPVLFMVNGTAMISSDVIVSASSVKTDCAGGLGGSTTTPQGTGGGGGGAFAGAGGSGGAGGIASGNAALVGSAGVPLVGSPLMLVPLRGGCRGGAGGVLENTGAPGGPSGGGGGAIQISARVELVVGGTIRANGNPGGSAMSSPESGGGGGGAGGGILLEAPTVIISGKLCAIGGGGGANQGNGSVSNCVGPGAGGSTGTSNGNGGNGGDGTTPAQAGVAGLSFSTPTGGGGGGGGAGVIRVRGAFSGTGTIAPPRT